MVPSVPLVLNGLARTMLMDLLPATTHAYGGQTLQLGAALAMMCAQEFDRAAARLVEENAALQRLFVDAAAVVDDAELRGRLHAAGAAPGAATLLVSDLHERNRRLRELLIALHAHVETRTDEAAGTIEARVWNELVASTDRRRLDMALA